MSNFLQRLRGLFRRESFIGGAPVLSPGERRALVQVARGDSHKIAANTLGLSPRTVSNQLFRAFRKLGVNNIAGAISSGLRTGELSASDLLEGKSL